MCDCRLGKCSGLNFQYETISYLIILTGLHDFGPVCNQASIYAENKMWMDVGWGGWGIINSVCTCVWRFSRLPLQFKITACSNHMKFRDYGSPWGVGLTMQVKEGLCLSVRGFSSST